MNSLLRRILMTGILAVTLTGSAAMACPNCKLANETESNRPRAYMYSILFMIGMPATIFTGFGISFYRMTRNAQRAAEQEQQGA